MKVKVSYTINLEEIPNKVKDLIKKNDQVLDKIRELSEDLTKGDLGAQSLRDLSDMKDKAAELAETYADCESILSGFLQAMFTNIKKDNEEVDGNDDNA